MKKKHTVGTVPKSNRNIVEIGKAETTNTHIYHRSLTWLSAGTSEGVIRNGQYNETCKIRYTRHKMHTNKAKNTTPHVLYTTIRKQTQNT